MQQVSVRELKHRLSASDPATAKPLVLDVREPWELQRCALPQATHIPMREIPARLVELDPDTEIVVMCHHGVRSQQVAYFLASRGYQKVFNLSGGIDAWAREVDPSMATY